MPTILNDQELGKLIGTVVVNGDPSCLKTNSYALRLGGPGEFLNVGKQFTLGAAKRGIKLQPGHSVAVTAVEVIDFSRATVRKIFPDHDLCGMISPTTDLSREGIVAPTTVLDAGYHGTPNWTITNTANEERRFIYNERLFRLTVFKLAPGETPAKPYEGDYQGQTGYVRSKRKGAPVGMRSEEWEDSTLQGSPEDLLEHLMKSGYPWHVLATKLKIIDGQFESVTEEYGKINDTLNTLRKEFDTLNQNQSEASKTLPQTIRTILQEETTSLQNRWLLAGGAMIGALIGVGLTIAGNDKALKFLVANGTWVGLVLVVCSVVVLLLTNRRRKCP